MDELKKELEVLLKRKEEIIKQSNIIDKAILEKQEEIRKKEEEERNNKSNEEKKVEIAKIYGIDLSDIEEVKLDNEKNFFKFYNPKDQSIKMINSDEDFGSLNEYFKNEQMSITNANSSDEKRNAEEIFENESKYRRTELSLLSIEEVKNNFNSYEKYLGNLKIEEQNAIKTLISLSDELNLVYINFENMIGIDKNRKVVNVTYNPDTKEYEVKEAKVIKYDHEKKESMDNDLDSVDYDAIVEEMDVSSNTPIIILNEEIYPNKLSFIDNYDGDPDELIYNSTMTDKQKGIYSRLAHAYKRNINRSKTSNM